MAGNSRSRKHKMWYEAGSSCTANKQPLSDGSRRRHWKMPETKEEWSTYGITNADFPITEEEEGEWENACSNYMYEHGWNEPPRYSDRLVNPNPPASQVMPDDLKKSCMEADEEIKSIKEIWLKNREIQLEKEELIEKKNFELAEMQKEIEVLKQDISEEAMTVRDIKETYTVLERTINEKAKFIVQCKNMYPY